MTMLSTGRSRSSCFLATLLALLTLTAARASENLDSVQQLQAIAEITQLRARLSNAIDNRRWDELRDSILTTDTVTDIPASLTRGPQAEGRTRIEGAKATIEFMRGVLGDKPGGSHAVTTPMIEVTSATTAKATWRLGTASYFDTYEKVDGQWRVKSIRFEPQAAAPAAATAVAPIDRLLAIEDIKQLKARYFRCVDQKDWECWRNVFSPDFVYQRPSGAIRGGDGMIEFIKMVGLSDRVKTVHHGHMPEIEILSPTTARGIWAANYLHHYPLGQPYETTGKEVAAPGKGNETFTYYYETYVKIDGKWFIQTMDNASHRLRTDDSGGILIPESKAK